MILIIIIIILFFIRSREFFNKEYIKLDQDMLDKLNKRDFSNFDKSRKILLYKNNSDFIINKQIVEILKDPRIILKFKNNDSSKIYIINKKIPHIVMYYFMNKKTIDKENDDEIDEGIDDESYDDNDEYIFLKNKVNDSYRNIYELDNEMVINNISNINHTNIETIF